MSAKPLGKLSQYIIANPTESYSQIAKACGTMTGHVKQKKHLLRKTGRLTQHEALETECAKVGVPLDSVSHYWYKGDHFSIFSKTKEVDYDTIANDLTDRMLKYSPVYPVIKYPKHRNGHLLTVDPADIHIGKLCKAFETGDEYNTEIAKQRVREGVAGILQKSNGFELDQILLIIGNDILHVDNAKSSTTAGTHQNTDLMWYDAFNTALELYVEVIEILATVAPVHIQYDPSNHDYLTGFFLANTLRAWFRKHKSVTLNVSIAHRKYYRYGANLIGTTHGDGAKEIDLPMLMAHEAKADWAECNHKYWFTHHIHHKRSRDYMSVNVETLRSPSGTDSWHHRNGYQHAPKAVEGFIFHKDHGQVARLTHLF